MRYSQISVAITVLFLCFISCRETIGEQHNSHPKENATPPSQKEKVEPPIQEKDILEPKTPQDKENKKKKASDTLRPKIAIL